MERVEGGAEGSVNGRVRWGEGRKDVSDWWQAKNRTPCVPGSTPIPARPRGKQVLTLICWIATHSVNTRVGRPEADRGAGDRGRRRRGVTFFTGAPRRRQASQAAGGASERMGGQTSRY